MAVWDQIKKRLNRAEDFHRLDENKKSRERLCELCATPLKVTREYAHAWTFKCDGCKSVEVHGKAQVGGTVGAGETEKE